jgi:hypothetical protein
MSGPINPTEPPGQDSPDSFRLLVRSCIETYKELPNDAKCLDYNRVAGKLRALVLDDEEYKRETRNIYARQCLEELREISSFTKNPLGMEEDEDGRDPRGKGKKKISTADKDVLAMRIKAVQMRREIIASMNEDGGAAERDAVNFLYVAMSVEEVVKGARSEIYEGGDDGDLDALTGSKEEAPEGTSGKIRGTGKTGQPDDGEFFETLADGEIVEK